MYSLLFRIRKADTKTIIRELKNDRDNIVTETVQDYYRNLFRANTIEERSMRETIQSIRRKISEDYRVVRVSTLC